MANEYNVSSTSYDSRIKLVDKFLDNMLTQKQKTGMSGVLLSGDPGVGKTSFVRFFSTLLGIKMVIIEAPHITEEHIINIPFIIFDPTAGSDKDGNIAKDQAADYKIVLSQSHLVSQLNSIQKVSDAQYLSSMKGAPADVRKIFESYGGDDKTIPEEFQEVRDDFKALLFLDEFYRQTSTRIRNMLRGILNGKIGTDNVPPGTYVMYASNLEDNNDSVEGIPLNHQYAKTIEFKAPDKDDWFGWLVGKFENDKKVQLNMKVVNKFYELLDKESINHKDVAKDVRVSPRRWEQLILYINANIPVANEREATDLMSNVRINFRNYLTGAVGGLADKVMEATAQLIKETSDITVSSSKVNDDSDWRETLEHQIATKIKLGEHRKYIPILSGPPGVGKTSYSMRVAENQDLRYVHIDCSTLDAEDVIGIPLSKTNSDGSIETSFSEPKLYKQIYDEIKILDKEYLQELKEDGKDEEAKNYKNREYKYLINFDELNRTSAKVFNGLRKVLLEKSFGDNRPMPEGSIMLASINPSDRGASELTNHMRDVVDIIETGPSWEKTKQYLESMPVVVKNELSKRVALDTVKTFADKFRVKGTDNEIPAEQREFYLDIGIDLVYISPREYSDLYSNSAVGFDRMFNRHVKGKEFDNETALAAEHKLRDYLSDAFIEALRNIMFKQDVDSPEFLIDLYNWMMQTPEIDIGEDVFYKKNATGTFASIIDPYFQDSTKNLVDDEEFINYINTAEVHKLKSDLLEFSMDRLQDAEMLIDNLTTKKFAKKTVIDDAIETVAGETVSKFEHIYRELILTFKVHQLSNDKRQAVKEAVLNCLSEICNECDDEIFDEMMAINGSFTIFAKNI